MKKLLAAALFALATACASAPPAPPAPDKYDVAVIVVDDLGYVDTATVTVDAVNNYPVNKFGFVLLPLKPGKHELDVTAPQHNPVNILLDVQDHMRVRCVLDRTQPIPLNSSQKTAQ